MAIIFFTDTDHGVGHVDVIDEAAPNQLLEASTRANRGHTTTIVRFRRRSAMRLRGTDAEEASMFARNSPRSHGPGTSPTERPPRRGRSDLAFLRPGPKVKVR